jgi:hypothetical protein
LFGTFIKPTVATESYLAAPPIRSDCAAFSNSFLVENTEFGIYFYIFYEFSRSSVHRPKCGHNMAAHTIAHRPLSVPHHGYHHSTSKLTPPPSHPVAQYPVTAVIARKNN